MEERSLTREEFKEIIDACIAKYGEIKQGRYSSSFHYKLDDDSIPLVFRAAITMARDLGVPKEYFSNRTTKETLANSVWAPEECTRKEKKESRARGIAAFVNTITVFVQDIYNTAATVPDIKIVEPPKPAPKDPAEEAARRARVRTFLDAQPRVEENIDPEIAKMMGLTDE